MASGEFPTATKTTQIDPIISEQGLILSTIRSPNTVIRAAEQSAEISSVASASTPSLIPNTHSSAAANLLDVNSDEETSLTDDTTTLTPTVQTYTFNGQTYPVVEFTVTAAANRRKVKTSLTPTTSPYSTIADYSPQPITAADIPLWRLMNDQPQHNKDSVTDNHEIESDKKHDRQDFFYTDDKMDKDIYNYGFDDEHIVEVAEGRNNQDLFISGDERGNVDNLAPTEIPILTQFTSTTPRNRFQDHQSSSIAGKRENEDEKSEFIELFTPSSFVTEILQNSNSNAAEFNNLITAHQSKGSISAIYGLNDVTRLDTITESAVTVETSTDQSIFKKEEHNGSNGGEYANKEHDNSDGITEVAYNQGHIEYSDNLDDFNKDDNESSTTDSLTVSTPSDNIDKTQEFITVKPTLSITQDSFVNSNVTKNATNITQDTTVLKDDGYINIRQDTPRLSTIQYGLVTADQAIQQLEYPIENIENFGDIHNDKRNGADLAVDPTEIDVHPKPATNAINKAYDGYKTNTVTALSDSATVEKGGIIQAKPTEPIVLGNNSPVSITSRLLEVTDYNGLTTNHTAALLSLEGRETSKLYNDLFRASYTTTPNPPGTHRNWINTSDPETVNSAPVTLSLLENMDIKATTNADKTAKYLNNTDRDNRAFIPLTTTSNVDLNEEYKVAYSIAVNNPTDLNEGLGINDAAVAITIPLDGALAETTVTKGRGFTENSDIAVKEITTAKPLQSSRESGSIYPQSGSGGNGFEGEQFITSSTTENSDINKKNEKDVSKQEIISGVGITAQPSYETSLTKETFNVSTEGAYRNDPINWLISTPDNLMESATTKKAQVNTDSSQDNKNVARHFNNGNQTNKTLLITKKTISVEANAKTNLTFVTDYPIVYSDPKTQKPDVYNETIDKQIKWGESDDKLLMPHRLKEEEKQQRTVSVKTTASTPLNDSFKIGNSRIVSVLRHTLAGSTTQQPIAAIGAVINQDDSRDGYIEPVHSLSEIQLQATTRRADSITMTDMTDGNKMNGNRNDSLNQNDEYYEYKSSDYAENDYSYADGLSGKYNVDYKSSTILDSSNYKTTITTSTLTFPDGNLITNNERATTNSKTILSTKADPRTQSDISIPGLITPVLNNDDDQNVNFWNDKYATATDFYTTHYDVFPLEGDGLESKKQTYPSTIQSPIAELSSAFQDIPSENAITSVNSFTESTQAASKKTVKSAVINSHIDSKSNGEAVPTHFVYKTYKVLRGESDLNKKTSTVFPSAYISTSLSLSHEYENSSKSSIAAPVNENTNSKNDINSKRRNNQNRNRPKLKIVKTSKTGNHSKLAFTESRVLKNIAVNKQLDSYNNANEVQSFTPTLLNVITKNMSDTVDTNAIGNSTITGHGISTGPAIGIIIGSVIGFWLILGPLLYLACRLRDKAKERRSHSQNDEMGTRLVEEMVRMELARGRDKKYHISVSDMNEIEPLKIIQENEYENVQNLLDVSQKMTFAKNCKDSCVLNIRGNENISPVKKDTYDIIQEQTADFPYVVDGNNIYVQCKDNDNQSDLGYKDFRYIDASTPASLSDYKSPLSKFSFGTPTSPHLTGSDTPTSVRDKINVTSTPTSIKDISKRMFNFTGSPGSIKEKVFSFTQCGSPTSIKDMAKQAFNFTLHRSNGSISVDSGIEKTANSILHDISNLSMIGCGGYSDLYNTDTKYDRHSLDTSLDRDKSLSPVPNDTSSNEDNADDLDSIPSSPALSDISSTDINIAAVHLRKSRSYGIPPVKHNSNRLGNNMNTSSSASSLQLALSNATTLPCEEQCLYSVPLKASSCLNYTESFKNETDSDTNQSPGDKKLPRTKPPPLSFIDTTKYLICNNHVGSLEKGVMYTELNADCNCEFRKASDLIDNHDYVNIQDCTECGGNRRSLVQSPAKASPIHTGGNQKCSRSYWNGGNKMVAEYARLYQDTTV